MGLGDLSPSLEKGIAAAVFQPVVEMRLAEAEAKLSQAEVAHRNVVHQLQAGAQIELIEMALEGGIAPAFVGEQDRPTDLYSLPEEWQENMELFFEKGRSR